MSDIERSIEIVHIQIGRIESALADILAREFPQNQTVRDIMATNCTDLLEDLKADLRRLEEKKAALALADPVPVEAN